MFFVFTDPDKHQDLRNLDTAIDRLLKKARQFKAGRREKKIVDLSWRETPAAGRISHALVNGITEYIETNTEEAAPNLTGPCCNK